MYLSSEPKLGASAANSNVRLAVGLIARPDRQRRARRTERACASPRSSARPGFDDDDGRKSQSASHDYVELTVGR